MSVRSCGCENATGDGSFSPRPPASLALPLVAPAPDEFKSTPKKGVKRSVCDFRMFFKATQHAANLQNHVARL